jgi:hypothetical protein
MAAMSRDKGKRAEREIVKLLQPVVIAVWNELGREGAAPTLERNLMQSHKGGHDLIGLDWLALEVKHREQFVLASWWRQAKTQAEEAEAKLHRPVEPVLFYRRNNIPWRVVMFGYLDSGSAGRVRCPVDITPDAFLAWFRLRLAQELTA